MFHHASEYEMYQSSIRTSKKCHGAAIEILVLDNDSNEFFQENVYSSLRGLKKSDGTKVVEQNEEKVEKDRQLKTPIDS
jgi:hypothetical protein